MDVWTDSDVIVDYWHAQDSESLYFEIYSFIDEEWIRCGFPTDSFVHFTLLGYRHV